MAKLKLKVKPEEKVEKPAVTYKYEELIPHVTAELVPGIVLRDILNQIIDKLNKI